MPDIARGFLATLTMDFETAFKVPPTKPGGVVLPFNAFSLQASQNQTSPQTIRGVRDPTKPFRGFIADSGNTVVPVDSVAFGYWLKGLFGAPETAATETPGENDGDPAVQGPPYTHVFKVRKDSPSMVLEVDMGADPKVHARHSGVKVASLAMSIGGDGELTSTIALEGADVQYPDAPYNANAPLAEMVRIDMFQVCLKMGGLPVAEATAFDFTIANNLQTDLYGICSGGTRIEIPAGVMGVTGNITTMFRDKKYLQMAKNGEELTFELTLEHDAGNKIVFTFPEVQLSYNSPTIDGPAGIMLTSPWIAYWDNHESHSCVAVTVTNGLASY